MSELKSAELSTETIDRKRIAEMHRMLADPPAPTEGDDKPEGIENLCPFGCLNEELNDIGHCKHLVGFTTNNKTFEPQTRRMRVARDPEGRILRDDDGKIIHEWDGVWITDGRKESIQLVRPTDVLKNGGKLTRPGVSSRVYRADADVFQG
jgi:hypothetical protein